MLTASDSVAPWPVEAPTDVEVLFTQDSLYKLWSGCDSCERTSLFAGHSLQPSSDAAAVRINTVSPDWVFFVVVLLVAMVSLYLNRRKMKLLDLIVAGFTSRRLERLERESGTKSLWGFLPMSIFFIFEVALVLLYASQSMSLQLPSSHAFLNYMLLLLLTMLFVLLRNGLTLLLGATYDCQSQSLAYLSNSCVHHMIGSLLLMPLLCLLFYGNASMEIPMFFASMAAIILTEAVRVLRGVYIIFSKVGNRSLYLFYYLCILELVPALVLVKLLNIL